MRLDRTRIAAGATMLALGALAAVALGSGGGTEPPAGAAATPAPQVRTEVVRRTVHVKPKERAAQDAPTAAAVAASGAAPAPATAPAPSAPAAVPVSDDDRLDDDHGEDRDDRYEDRDDRYEDHGGDDDDD